MPQGHRGARGAVLEASASRRAWPPGERVLVAAHGNSLRALIKYFDGMSDEAIVGVNVPDRHPARLRARRRASKPLRSYYLGDAEAVAQAQHSVASQGKAK